MRGADMPSFQGELDGLCGPYAIVNAFEECGLADDGEAIFKACCKALSAARWPAQSFCARPGGCRPPWSSRNRRGNRPR